MRQGRDKTAGEGIDKARRMSADGDALEGEQAALVVDA